MQILSGYRRTGGCGRTVREACSRFDRRTLARLARKLKGQGIKIVLAELRDDVRENLKAIGADQDLGPIAAHRSIEDCLPRG